jgi:hypothetical protein
MTPIPLRDPILVAHLITLGGPTEVKLEGKVIGTFKTKDALVRAATSFLKAAEGM